MREVMAGFAVYLKGKGLSPSTIQFYCVDVEQFLLFINKEINKLAPGDIKLHIQNMKKSYFSIKTINRKITSYNNFVSFMQEVLGIDYFIREEHIRKQTKEHIEDYLSKEEYLQLISVAADEEDVRAQALFMSLYYTGARISEVLQITRDDIDKDIITVKAKWNTYRDIFIPSVLKDAWKNYLPHRKNTSNVLFTSQKGPLSRSAVHRIIQKYAELSQIPSVRVNSTSFRNLYSINLVEQGIDIDIIADLAGYRDAAAVKIFTRKSKKELLETINNVFSK